jgi:aarF domain-containing kinase
MMGMDCAEQSLEAALIQLIETGVMHADLHAGNTLTALCSSLIFLICHMEKKHQGAMLALIAHLVNGEWHSLTDNLADMMS